MEKELLVINKYSPVHLYRQLENYFIKSIKSGRFPYGSFLPKETDLCEIYDISLFVVKTAYTSLKKAGYIKTIKRTGAFVIYRPVMNVGISDVLNFDKYNSSIKPNYEILSVNAITHHDIAYGLLGIEEGTSLTSIKRRILFGHTPICFQSIYLLPALFEKQKGFSDGLFSLESFLENNSDGQLHHQFMPINLEAWQALYLEMKPNDSGHFVKTVLLDKNKLPLVCVLSIFPGQHIQWEVKVL